MSQPSNFGPLVGAAVLRPPEIPDLESFWGRSQNYSQLTVAEYNLNKRLQVADYRPDTAWPIWRLALILALGIGVLSGCHRKPRPIIMLPNTSWASQELWRKAGEAVEEDRNEPMGSRASVQVPDELKQYSNRHQFLGTQLAEFHKEGYKIPKDYADLAELIREGQLFEMPPVGRDYVLFGIGGRADRGLLTHYDPATGSSIPLYPDEHEVDKASSGFDSRIDEATGSILELGRQLRALGRRDRRRAASLRAEISNRRNLIASLVYTKTAIDSWYRDPARRAELLAKYRRLAGLASDFGGFSYDLGDPEARLEFKMRLLGCIRPAARSILEEIAADYDREFKRPLPVTSMVRTIEYQKQLGEVNPNAARNAVPPHTTGLAFDVYYHYMTAAEQNFLMNEIARMKDAGRVEALRETRDHFHIFAFGDGQRPSGQLIAESTSELGDKAAAGMGRSRLASTIKLRPTASTVRAVSHRRTRS